MLCILEASKECIQLKANMQIKISMEILKMMIFPVSLPCKVLVYSVEVLGGLGDKQLFPVSFIFSKGQINYLSRKAFEELQCFSRKSWEIAWDPWGPLNPQMFLTLL